MKFVNGDPKNVSKVVSKATTIQVIRFIHIEHMIYVRLNIRYQKFCNTKFDIRFKIHKF